MTKHNWSVYVCRYAKRYHCSCDFVICNDCYDKRKISKSRRHTVVNKKKQYDMFNPFFDEHNEDGRCVNNPVEYHKNPNLIESRSAHIWTSSWGSQKQNQNSELIFPSYCCKNCMKKFEVK